MEKTVNHIGIILDGNRRWAKQLALHPWKGHEKGAEKFRTFLDWCEELNINEITAYTFSMQNFNRAQDEIKFLMKLFVETAKKTLIEENIKLADEKGARFRFIGRRQLLPENLQKLIKEIEEKTEKNNKKTINICLAYGGREEITDALKKIAEKIEKRDIKKEDINEELITENLYIKNDPDLIIRTSGEQRTSNFLPWQSIYSEWFFLKKSWPEIEKEDLIEVLKEYKNNRKRRFGK